jgi:tetratricopeptide (TPR) repeat protein
MGKVLVEKIGPVIDKMNWPGSAEATELGRKVYEVGLDQADDFRADPKPLIAALRTFQSGDSAPYAYAGIAYTLIKASREKDGNHAESGLSLSLEWLEKAQEMAPDVLEINMVEAFIYVYSGRFEDARLVLDYLEEINPADYYVLRGEIAYWQEQENLEEAIQWYAKATEAAETVPQKLRLRQDLGDCYYRFKQYDQAVTIYKEATHFSAEDEALWHKMSLAYWRMEEFVEAAHCNRRVLKIKADHPEALKMQEALKEKLDSGGITKRILGR